jgi:hypothetical protein
VYLSLFAKDNKQNSDKKTMARKFTVIALVLLVLFGRNSFAQSFEGVYQLEVENEDGQGISKGTGFYVNSGISDKSYIVTSFHLLNSRLLEAAKIKITNLGKDIYLKIAGYDDLNDILVLSSKEILDESWSFGKNCNGKVEVTGFHNSKLTAVEVEDGLVNSEVDAVKKLSVYLSKGFSGAPLFNNNAEICGMVVLSSEQNASSIVVSNKIIKSVIATVGSDLYSVREVRIALGVEKIVRNQQDLDRILSESNTTRQLVIGLAPVNKSETFLVKNANNVIVDAYTDISKLVIHQSKNIMVRNVKAERIMVNESTGVTVTGCIFNSMDQALLLRDSSNLYVKGNLFKGIDTGIVIKSASIDEKQLNTDNVFVAVLNTIKNI